MTLFQAQNLSSTDLAGRTFGQSLSVRDASNFLLESEEQPRKNFVVVSSSLDREMALVWQRYDYVIRELAK